MSNRIRTAIRVMCIAGVQSLSAAFADTISITPAKDNTIFSADGNASNGQGDLFCGTSGEGNVRRMLLAFDVAGNVPAGSTILSAGLTLTLVRAARESGAEDLERHRVLQDWGEGDSLEDGGPGAPADDGDATWSFRFFSDQDKTWDNPGGDFAPESSGPATVGRDLGPYTFASTPQTVADVQDWLDQPDGNFGWIIRGNESMEGTSRRFASRETMAATDRPTLAVEFEAPPPPPPAPRATRFCGFGMVGAMLAGLAGITGIREFTF